MIHTATKATFNNQPNHSSDFTAGLGSVSSEKFRHKLRHGMLTLDKFQIRQCHPLPISLEISNKIFITHQKLV